MSKRKVRSQDKLLASEWENQTSGFRDSQPPRPEYSERTSTKIGKSKL